MDSQYHNLRAHTAEVGATASDTAETGNTVQPLAYRRGLQDDEGNEEEGPEAIGYRSVSMCRTRKPHRCQ